MPPFSRHRRTNPKSENVVQQAIAQHRSVIIQNHGHHNTFNVGGPHEEPYLRLADYRGLYARVAKDPETGRPNETDLLRPHTRAISLVGRKRELASLLEWLRGTPPISALVMTGGPGVGKTRLALELAREANDDRWDAGFLERNDLNRFLSQSTVADWRWHKHTLVIIDDAAATAPELSHWLQLLARHICWEQRPDTPDTELHDEPPSAASDVRPSVYLFWNAVQHRGRVGGSMRLNGLTNEYCRRCSLQQYQFP